MEEQFIEKKAILEVNCLEKIIYFRNYDTSTLIPDDIWNEVVLNFLIPEWHDPGKDEIEFFVFYNDNSYFCQKKRKRLDYTNQSYYWQSYQFNEKSVEQATEVYDMFTTVGFVEQKEQTDKWLEDAKTLISNNQAFFDEKWSILKKQINEMLYFSDWRVLPDVIEKFPGETDLWIKWRKWLRECLPSSDQFSTPYELFKFCYEFKFAIDPKMYLEKYPNQEVEYLSTEDQFSSYEFNASFDYMSRNIYNIQEYIQSNVNNEIKLSTETTELIKKLKLRNYYPDLLQKLIGN
jgi:hypothetical protein